MIFKQTYNQRVVVVVGFIARGQCRWACTQLVVGAEVGVLLQWRWTMEFHNNGHNLVGKRFKVCAIVVVDMCVCVCVAS